VLLAGFVWRRWVDRDAGLNPGATSAGRSAKPENGACSGATTAYLHILSHD